MTLLVVPGCNISARSRVTPCTQQREIAVMRLMPRLLVVYALAAALFGIVVFAMRDAPTKSRSAPAIPSRNAAWIDHHWVGTLVPRSSIASLCIMLTTHEIGAVFVHVGPADASGNIAAGRAPYAQRFVTT